MGKITVKHYLNTNLKPYLIGDEKYYKVYFLLRYQNKSTKLKSITNLEYTESEYKSIIEDSNNIINKRLNNEVVFIEKIIETIEILNIPFDIQVFNDFLHIATYPIIEKFQKYIVWQNDRISQLHGTIHEQTNFLELSNVLNQLKRFVIDNPNCFSDEIYFAQLKELDFRKGLEGFLKEDKVLCVWELVPNTKELKLGDIIENEYKRNEYNSIDYITEKLLIDNKFHLDFQKCITGATGDTTNYLQKIIDYYSNN